MKLFSRSVVISSLLALILVVAGCSLSSEKLPDDSSGEPGDSGVKWLLVEDFSSPDLAGQGWLVEFVGGTEGAVEVVSAPELESGHALRMAGHIATPGVRISKPLIQDDLEDIETIVVEHSFKAISGGPGANVHIVVPQSVLNWQIQPDVGKLFYREGTSMREVADIIDDEWNVLRIVADRVNNEVFVFLNDEEVPVVAGAQFRNVPDSWAGATFWIQHSPPSESERLPAEILYGDVKVWALD